MKCVFIYICYILSSGSWSCSDALNRLRWGECGVRAWLIPPVPHPAKPGEGPRELRPAYAGLAGVSCQPKPRPEWP